MATPFNNDNNNKQKTDAGCEHLSSAAFWMLTLLAVLGSFIRQISILMLYCDYIWYLLLFVVYIVERMDLSVHTVISAALIFMGLNLERMYLL